MCASKMNETASETSSSKNASDEGNAIEALFELSKSEAAPGVDELDLAAELITKEQLQLEQSARTLLEEAQTNTDASLIPGLKEQAQSIRHSCIQIHEFANKYQPQDDSPWTYIAGGTRIVALLSDIHQVIRAVENGNIHTGDHQWVPSSSFERYTRKYLINEGHLAQTLLYCASEVPLLVYGKTGTLLTNENDDSSSMTDIWQTHLATQVSSVYFDSPDLNLYSRRVAREEGARLFRVRWYGNKKPQGDELLFLELKTHHESWVMDKSIKQRVVLREKDLAALLARDGSEWTRAFMEELLLLATPSLQGKDLDDAVALLHEIRTLIIEKGLRPIVRTRYLRMAFQSNDTNARRLTIDRDVTVLDESSAPLGRWCAEQSDEATAVKVPYAVLEVKLKENDDPAFIHELLDMNAIHDGLKFSKYLTGAMSLHSEKVNTTPYWATLPVFDGLFDLSLQRNKPTKRRVSMSRPARRFSDFSVTSIRRRSSVASGPPSTQQNISTPSKVKRVRIEPKTYFANERTFIQWVSVALLLVTIATLLLGIGVDEGLNAPRAMSISLVFAALFITIYACGVYFRRLYLLKNGKSYGYIDHTGPIILTAAVLMGVIGLLYYTFNIGTSPNPSDSSPVYQVASEDPQGECKMHNFTGISLLEYQPSDIVLDETGDMLIIPSQSKVTGLPLDAEADPFVSVLGEVPDTDIEAVAFAKGILYAVSESKGSSLLLAFEPRAVGTRTVLDLVGEWKLDGRSSTEGMAYANDDKLHISEGADSVTGESHVYVYDIPAVVANSTDGEIESIFPLYQLNGKVLTAGISPSEAKMGSMTFFEDVLYILHDNARVVRGWNLESGAMVSEWILPRVGKEFDQQWEGMALQRVASTEENKNNLRGSTESSSSTVVLYLALDSPPQIWSFRMKEMDGEIAKNYAFPDCAAAFK